MTFKAIKGLDGRWCLRTKDDDTVVDKDGFVVWFTSKAKALAAAPSVVFDEREEWWILK